MKKTDSNFIPLIDEIKYFGAKTLSGVTAAVSRPDGSSLKYTLKGVADGSERSFNLIERTVKTLLYTFGGTRIFIAGDGSVAKRLKTIYSESGERAFDARLMRQIYGEKLEVFDCKIGELPKNSEKELPVSGNLDGCRVGLDVGGSDIKVCAVSEGKKIYSEEIRWQPKQECDAEYHIRGILGAVKKAASYLTHTDALGVSSAGVIKGNRIITAALFGKVDKDVFSARLSGIYERAAEEIGAKTLAVLNDGDVSAIASAEYLGGKNILGVAMGTGEAAGYAFSQGGASLRLSELGLAPLALNRERVDSGWSGDGGVGSQYLSQTGIIRLCELSGTELKGDSPAEKLSYIQEMCDKGDKKAQSVFAETGYFLGCALALYAEFYPIDKVMLMGRVVSGKAGGIIYSEAMDTLKKYCLDFTVCMPDEKFKRLGQCYTAASIPKIVRG